MVKKLSSFHINHVWQNQVSNPKVVSSIVIKEIKVPILRSCVRERLPLRSWRQLHGGSVDQGGIEFTCVGRRFPCRSKKAARDRRNKNGQAWLGPLMWCKVEGLSWGWAGAHSQLPHLSLLHSLWHSVPSSTSRSKASLGVFGLKKIMQCACCHYPGSVYWWNQVYVQLRCHERKLQARRFGVCRMLRGWGSELSTEEPWASTGESWSLRPLPLVKVTTAPYPTTECSLGMCVECCHL